MFQIKEMSLEELELAVDWAALEGWNPGKNDAALYHQTDPSGFLIGYLDSTPIACISAVKYSADFGFLGFYIVHPDFRGQGYGLKIWQAAMHHLAGCNVGLDGVVDQQANYKKSGFRYAHANFRYQCHAQKSKQENGQRLFSFKPEHLPELLAYLSPFFPEAREAFMHAWLTQADSVAYIYRESNTIQGCALARPCLEGYKIAPLFADNVDIADQLLSKLKSQLPQGSPLFIDLPEINTSAQQLIQRHALQQVFETARMYTGDTPAIGMERTYGITSFEIG